MAHIDAKKEEDRCACTLNKIRASDSLLIIYRF